MRTWGGVRFLVLGVALPALAWTAHARLLRAAGEALVVDEPLRKVDVIVVAADAFDEGLADAAALERGGISSRVAVFTIVPNAVLRTLAFPQTRRGPTARAVATLDQDHVPIVEQIPAPVTGTTDSVPALLDWCTKRGFRTVVMITTSDHSRRLRRVLDRTLDGRHDLRVTVRVARHSIFNPEDWWVHPGGIYKAMVEVPKLLVDVARHPLS